MDNEPRDIPPDQQPEPTDWREQRADARQERREARWEARQERRDMRSSDAWIGGTILILIGLVFLLRNLVGFSLENWWALFILIPAFGSFAAARNIYASNGGRFTSAVRSPLIGGFFLTMLALAFLIGIEFQIFLPILMIMGGVVLLVNWLIPD